MIPLPDDLRNAPDTSKLEEEEAKKVLKKHKFDQYMFYAHLHSMTHAVVATSLSCYVTATVSIKQGVEEWDSALMTIILNWGMSYFISTIYFSRVYGSEGIAMEIHHFCCIISFIEP